MPTLLRPRLCLPQRQPRHQHDKREGEHRKKKRKKGTVPADSFASWLMRLPDKRAFCKPDRHHRRVTSFAFFAKRGFTDIDFLGFGFA